MRQATQTTSNQICNKTSQPNFYLVHTIYSHQNSILRYKFNPPNPILSSIIIQFSKRKRKFHKYTMSTINIQHLSLSLLSIHLLLIIFPSSTGFSNPSILLLSILLHLLRCNMCVRTHIYIYIYIYDVLFSI